MEPHDRDEQGFVHQRQPFHRDAVHHVRDTSAVTPMATR